MSDNGSSGVVLSNSSQDSFTVRFPNGRGGAGSRVGSCSCGYSEAQHFPCEHIVAYANEKNIPAHEIVPVEYHTRTYRQQYDSSLTFQDVSVCQVRSKSPDKLLNIPPDVPRKRGRTTKRRALSFIERSNIKRPYLYSKCKAAGHTAAKCTAELLDE